MAPKKRSTDALVKELRTFGLTYPGAGTKSPWPGHMDLAVKDKTFAFMSVEGEPFSISCKLPESSLAALSLPHASPTGYGLGKSGWVNMALPEGEDAPPVELLKAWIDESYRAQAPKKLVASLDAAKGAAVAAPKLAAKPRTAKRKSGAPAPRKKAARSAAAGRRKG